MAFTVFLDSAACPLPLADDHQPTAPAVARYVVRGSVARGNGRVRVEAEAGEQGGPTRRGTGEAEGDDAAAVASATRTMLAQLHLVCRR